MNNNYEMTSDFIKAYKRCLIETMKAFISFCSENNIKYFCTGGTAIGAVRHKGFIPWDDDIDVCMLREDYDRFISLREKCQGTGYKIEDYHDKGNPVPYGKFVNMNTTLVEVDRYPYSSGVFIDVFPLDNVTDDIDEAKKIKDKVMVGVDTYQRTVSDLYWKDLLMYFRKGHIKSIIQVFENRFFYHHLYKKYSNVIIENENLLRSISGDYVLNYYTLYKIEKEIFPKEWFSSTVVFTFEDIYIQLPIGYHEYMTKLFGDYMTLPPLEKQVSHHSQYYCNLKEHLSIEDVRDRVNKGERYVM